MDTPDNWLVKVRRMMPLLGHRNWILVVDSAYPLQTSPGIETIETGEDEIDVVEKVLDQVDHSIHVRPMIYMDAELPFVPERDAPGVTRYRQEIQRVLGNRPMTSLPHEEIIRKVGETGRSFHILVLKTKLTIPYTSVFLELNCKYWSDSAEAALRKAMKDPAGK
ncbi:hypothetical protein ACPOL_5164 [Acidisarcina polymorpha]|uniref:D-ribose pyranase n=1 Tax=Acidisarcina polymorpha TaxID=2211140 RepID=A0A2Z5G5P0_9BACT|nr:hypothetical protein [Acidisarcina polymorpha]AXC14418.1 hypothetical protein ACPOL_5164 [Acidisarcina polymorpha]